MSIFLVHTDLESVYYNTVLFHQINQNHAHRQVHGYSNPSTPTKIIRKPHSSADAKGVHGPRGPPVTVHLI